METGHFEKVAQKMTQKSMLHSPHDASHSIYAHEDGAVSIPESTITDQSGYNPTGDLQEPVYCICRQVSYGDMIGCDNPSCPIEWFHYACVGLTAPPKGKWYCPECSQKMNEQK